MLDAPKGSAGGCPYPNQFHNRRQRGHARRPAFRAIAREEHFYSSYVGPSGLRRESRNELTGSRGASFVL